MSKFQQIPYDPDNLESFDREWLCHRGVSEWWYATGYFYDENNCLFSFQYTLVRALVCSVRIYILMLAVTDIKTGRHYFVQQPALSEKKIDIDEKTLRFCDTATLIKEKTGIHIKATAADFTYDLFLDYGKGAFRHCDNGRLQMGIPDKRATTRYYSYTNMPAFGTITLDGITHTVTGKAWFDKQGGTYPITNPACMWEWFSLRFFDEEEIMLFSFPQDDYMDGTYIRKDRTSMRLNRYTITPKKFTMSGGYRFSCEWELSLPGQKDKHYLIRPLTDGQLNLVYFELLAGIYKDSGDLAGYCVAELLPGVYNKKINVLHLLKKQN
ncbi:MAG TPA: lipocalin-like domain-containing protein [Lachnospiraceae bacterium]|nr:lipocalin-like domain-containing protein [Lachnospiraceae bacterium]